MVNYYNSSQSAAVTLQIQDVAPVCTQDDARCQDGVSQICDANAWVAGGDSCTKPVPTIDPLILVASLGLVGMVGVALLTSGGKKKGR